MRSIETEGDSSQSEQSPPQSAIRLTAPPKGEPLRIPYFFTQAPPAS